jgi:hypothetical protein
VSTAEFARFAVQNAGPAIHGAHGRIQGYWQGSKLDPRFGGSVIVCDIRKDLPTIGIPAHDDNTAPDGQRRGRRVSASKGQIGLLGPLVGSDIVLVHVGIVSTVFILLVLSTKGIVTLFTSGVLGGDCHHVVARIRQVRFANPRLCRRACKRVHPCRVVIDRRQGTIVQEALRPRHVKHGVERCAVKHATRTAALWQRRDRGPFVCLWVAKNRTQCTW